jgi:microcystin-dependent protein
MKSSFYSKAIKLTTLFLFVFNSSISAQEGFLGEVKLFAGNFAPRNWFFCDGQLLPISENSALFSILGTMYGGDGRTTFALPDLRGRTAAGSGTGPGLTNRPQGQKFGTETTLISPNNIPNLSGITNIANKYSTDTAERVTPIEGDVPAPAHFTNGLIEQPIKSFGANTNTVNSSEYSATTLVNESTNNYSVNTTTPSIALRYIICIQGTHPSRN